MRNLLIRLLPFSKYLLIVWIVLIIVFSSIPNITSPKVETVKGEIRLDYIIHLVEYGALAILAILSFTGRNLHIDPRRVLIIMLILLVFAFIDEGHQLLIPGRTFNPIDLVFNTGGLLLGAALTLMILRKTRSIN